MKYNAFLARTKVLTSVFLVSIILSIVLSTGCYYYLSREISKTFINAGNCLERELADKLKNYHKYLLEITNKASSIKNNAEFVEYLRIQNDFDQNIDVRQYIKEVYGVDVKGNIMLSHYGIARVDNLNIKLKEIDVSMFDDLAILQNKALFNNYDIDLTLFPHEPEKLSKIILIRFDINSFINKTQRSIPKIYSKFFVIKYENNSHQVNNKTTYNIVKFAENAQILLQVDTEQVTAYLIQITAITFTIVFLLSSFLVSIAFLWLSKKLREENKQLITNRDQLKQDMQKQGSLVIALEKELETNKAIFASFNYLIMQDAKEIEVNLVPLKDVLQVALLMSAKLIHQKHIEFLISGVEGVLILANEFVLTRVITSIIRRSIKELPDDGEIRISIGQEQDFIDLIIEDNGFGFVLGNLPSSPPEKFYFYCIKDFETVQQIASGQGWELSIERSFKKGSKIMLKLPKKQNLLILAIRSLSLMLYEINNKYILRFIFLLI